MIEAYLNSTKNRRERACYWWKLCEAIAYETKILFTSKPHILQLRNTILKIRYGNYMYGSPENVSKEIWINKTFKMYINIFFFGNNVRINKLITNRRHSLEVSNLFGEYEVGTLVIDYFIILWSLKKKLILIPLNIEFIMYIKK